MTHVFQFNNRQIIGLTAVDDIHIYVLCHPSKQQIDVYDTHDCKRKESLKVNDLVDEAFNGLTSCDLNMCLYINDWQNSTVYMMRLTGNREVMKWKVDERPTGLSVNSAHNLLVTCHWAKKLQEYAYDGSLVREIDLQSNDQPWHSIQLSSNLYLVCIKGNTSKDGDVVEMNSHGEITIKYKSHLQSTTSAQFSWPRHLAVDTKNERIFIADYGNKRIVVLERSLNNAKEFSAQSATSADDVGLHKPQCLHVNKFSNRLFVGFVDDGVKGGRVCTFDIRRRQCSSSISASRTDV